MDAPRDPPSAAEPSDAALLESARGGDLDALDALIQRHERRVYRFGLKMCGDPEDAKDVLQETLLAMAKNLREFRGASSVSTWLYTIARSFCSKRRRRSKFAPALEQSLDSEVSAEVLGLSDPGRDPEEEAAARELSRTLDAAIRSLEPGYREVLLLRDVEGLTAPEVAEILGLGVEAVKSRLHRARRAVRELVAPKLLPPEASTPPPPAPCPDISDLFSRHLEHDISREVCAEMERHVAGCTRCAGVCATLQETLAMCRALPAPRVPPEVQDRIRGSVRTLLATSGAEG